MIFVPMLHYLQNKNSFSGNEDGMRYLITPGKRSVPDPDGGEEAKKEEKKAINRIFIVFLFNRGFLSLSFLLRKEIKERAYQGNDDASHFFDQYRRPLG